MVELLASNLIATAASGARVLSAHRETCLSVPDFFKALASGLYMCTHTNTHNIQYIMCVCYDNIYMYIEIERDGRGGLCPLLGCLCVFCVNICIYIYIYTYIYIHTHTTCV